MAETNYVELNGTLKIRKCFKLYGYFTIIPSDKVSELHDHSLI